MSNESTDRSTAASDRGAANRSLTWTVATVITVLMGLASAGVMTVAMFWIGDYYRGSQLSRDEEGRRKLEELRTAEQKELETYGWINQTEGVVRIPIDRAMQLLVEKDQREQPRAATPRSDQPPSSQRP
jgi:hypothetical protein